MCFSMVWGIEKVDGFLGSLAHHFGHCWKKPSAWKRCWGFLELVRRVQRFKLGLVRRVCAFSAIFRSCRCFLFKQQQMHHTLPRKPLQPW